ncbi:MAG: hypothetical protein ACRD0D_02245, partial [Acidimicrobiales bacterium]
GPTLTCSPPPSPTSALSSPATSASAIRAPTHPAAIEAFLLRLRDQQPDNVVAVLQRLATNHNLDELVGCVVVVTEGLVRIRWPE